MDAYSGGVHNEPLPIDYDSANPNLNLSFSISELGDAIRRTKITTSGEDKISAKLFKGLDSHSQNVLLQVYNSIWEAAAVPLDWSSAVILPNIKPGKTKKCTSSYCPIALTSVTCKIFERMISRRITNHLLYKRLFSHSHLG